MNAFFSFDLFIVYIPERKQRPRTINTRKHEILNTLKLGCSLITLRELCNNQRFK